LNIGGQELHDSLATLYSVLPSFKSVEMVRNVLRQSKVLLKDIILCHIDSTVTYPLFELFSMHMIIHVS